jgi:predicted ATPase
VEDEKPAPGSSDFGNLLRRHRLRAGLSQEALAERARVSVNGISALERGERRSPQRQTLELLADALDLGPPDRAAFARAARRPSTPRRDGGTVTLGPWEVAPKTNLPTVLTTFVGREAERDEIGELLARHRLVTLTGTGGVGKTRTSLEVARAVEHAYPDGVWLVELAPLDDPALVAGAVASALGFRHNDDRPLEAALAELLKRRRTLLLLDNCEHVVDEAARITHALLLAAPSLTILATSREALHVPGETTYRMPSLDAAESAALFAERARAASHTFVLDDGNAAAVARICRRLDGIALAIELAAARVSSLSPAILAEQLERHFDLLAGGLRTALPRQQTMRAAIAWSYDLLSPDERLLFERLSIFAGGCDFEAAHAVCGGAPLDAARIAMLLAALVEKSLVVADFDLPEPRYRLLDATRHFARERSEARGELEPIAHRHAQVFRDRATRIMDTIVRDAIDSATRAAVRLDIENWRSAIEFAFRDHNNLRLGLELTAEVAPLLAYLAPSEWLAVVAEAQSRCDATISAGLEARLGFAEATLNTALNRHEPAASAALRALPAARALGEPAFLGRVLWTIGVNLPFVGRAAEADPHLREAFDIAREHGFRRLLAMSFHARAAQRLFMNDPTGAREDFNAAAAAFAAYGDELRAAVAKVSVADVEDRLDDPEAAIRIFEETIGAIRMGGPHSVMHALVNQAGRLLEVGRLSDAMTCAREAVRIAAEWHNLTLGVLAMQHLACAIAFTAASASFNGAARLYGFLIARYGDAGPEWNEVEFARALEALRAAMPAAELARAMSEGAALAEDQAFEEAFAL